VATPRLHPWEKAGLGKAPFRWLGVEVKYGPIRIARADGTTLEIGAPGQPMGSCAFCGQGIAECHSIASADGKEFIVGCDCVRRVNAEGEKVRTAAERASLDLKNAAARARHAAKAAASRARLKELLDRPGFREELSAKPSAYAWKAEKGETAWDDLEWLANQCGHAGRLRLIKRLEKETV
jgi:hypothetical protein